MVGGVRSILIPARVIERTLLARSVACPDAERPVPSTSKVTGGVTASGRIPERESVAPKVTVTGPRFQPSALGGGDRVAVRMGGVESRLIAVVVLVVLPALST